MSVFNVENKGYVDGNYPLFLGEELGVIDTINVPYPQLDILRQEQDSQLWNEFEVDLTQDRQDMLEKNNDSISLMVKTISWQYLADSVAGRSILDVLKKHVTNSELEQMLLSQAYFEGIHARTYSHIVKQTFADPSKMIKDTYEDTKALSRSHELVRVYDKLDNLPEDASDLEKKCGILDALTALFALESISFMASFTVTFAVAETKICQGIGKLVTLICRDEVLHSRMDYNIISILQEDPDWNEAFELTRDSRKNILDECVNNECLFADYLFEDHSLIGLNSELLKDYIFNMSRPIYDILGLPCEFKLVKKHQLGYMDKYVKSTKIQPAAQEIQLSGYKVNNIIDDTDGLDLDFEV